MLKELEEKLELAKEANNAKDITVYRGRLIAKIKEEIKNIQKTESHDEETTKKLQELQEELDIQLQNHKTQISSRYKNEFLHEKATVPSLLTVLPKAVGLAVKKVNACINQLKESKTMKEKIYNTVETIKSFGMTIATPVIYAGKFAIDHWYLVLLLLLLLKSPKFNDKRKDDSNDNNPQNAEETVTETEDSKIKDSQAKPVDNQITDVAEETPNPLEKPTNSLETVTETEDSKIKDSQTKPVDNQITDVAEETPDSLEKPANSLQNTTETSTENQPSTVQTPHLETENTENITEINNMLADSEANKVFETKEKLLETLKELASHQNSSNNLIFDSYEDAINYFMQESAMTRDEAISLLNGTLTGSIPSVSWISGPNGLYTEEQLEALNNCTAAQLEEYMQSNQELIDLYLQQQETIDLSNVDVKSLIDSLGVSGALCILIKLGLAVKTGGASLVFG